MKVEIQKVNDIKKKLSIEVPYDHYTQEIDKAYEDLNKKVSIKGFRKGKAPLSILKKEYAGRVERDVISKLLEDSYAKAIQEHQVLAVSYPQFTDLKLEEGKPLSFAAEVEVQPEVQAQGYEGIALTKSELQVTREEIEKEIEHLRNAIATLVPVAEGVAATKGDFLTIDYKGSMAGEYPSDLSAANSTIELGLGYYLADFENGLLEIKKGETKTIDVNFPTDYANANYAGKKAQFEITVKEHKRKELPALDDELAKDVGPFQSLKELEEDIQKKIQEAKTKQQNSELFNQAMEYLLQKNVFEIPEAMVAREIDYMYRSAVRDLESRKLTPEQVGLTHEQFKDKNKEVATKRIRGFLILDSIAKQQKIEISQEELNQRLETIAKQYNQPAEAVKKYYLENNLLNALINQIIGEKVFDYLLAKAKVKETKV